MKRFFALLLTSWTVAVFASAAEDTSREALGRSTKFRILVDKVMQPEAKWVTEEWMVKETADAGFNVLSPRIGFDRLDEVRQVAQWCGDYGIYYMPWMRGSLAAPEVAEADGKRMVWENGSVQPLYSPNSDEFWEWTTRYVIEYAKLSAENPACIGVFLDYENYSRGGMGNLYGLSYDDEIMSAFADAQQIEIPELKAEERKPWLEEKGLHEAFQEFQVNEWRRRCRELRQAVDAISPSFQFCVYPAPGTMFMLEGVCPEWATEAAPLILADASTYGRPSKFLPQDEALAENKRKLQQRMQTIRDMNIPFIYAGGIDPVVEGADPEFSGKNAVAISEVTDGYWIFYEGPTYKGDHPEYWKWFSWANSAIAEGNFAAQHEPRETEEGWAAELVDSVTGVGKFDVPVKEGAPDYPQVRLRGGNMLLVPAIAGQPVTIDLQDVRVGQNDSVIAWELRDGAFAKTDAGTVTHQGTGTVAFTPEKDGLYYVGLSAGGCAYRVLRANVPLGIYAEKGASFIHGAERLYFFVPDGLEQFKVTAKGAGGETVRLDVYDAQGEPVATGQTTASRQSTDLDVAAGQRGGGVWSLALVKADDGPLEDCSVRIEGDLLPVLAFRPEEVFRSKAE